MMTLDQAVADLAAGAVAARVQGPGAVRFDSVSIDTRTLAPGALYVALRGERFDGHDFGGAAAAAGAVAVLAERPLAVRLPQIIVADSHAALGRLGAAWRSRLHLPLIGVAGSNGKTTTTQMIGAILAAAYGESAGESASEPAGQARWFATRGNRNNAIGVPLMLLELRAHHRAAVLELGMNHPGEIALLAGWARPTVGLVTNAQREHQEFLDSVEATAHENGAVIASLPADGLAVFPADDPCAPIWRAGAGARRIVDFALQGPAAVHGTAHAGPEGSLLRLQTPAGPVQAQLALAGLHNARNALAAAAAAAAIGVAPDAIGAGLAAFRPVSGRGTRRAGRNGAVLIDETYNANPDSVRAAIDLLAGQRGLRVLVLGDMGEVGAHGAAFHREVGGYARERGIDRLLALGELSAGAVAAFGPGARHSASIEALIDAASAATAASAGATVLVKGSRFMRLERVVAALELPGAAPSPAGQEAPPHHA